MQLIAYNKERSILFTKAVNKTRFNDVREIAEA